MALTKYLIITLDCTKNFNTNNVKKKQILNSKSKLTMIIFCFYSFDLSMTSVYYLECCFDHKIEIKFDEI